MTDRTARDAVALTLAELAGKVFTLVYTVIAARVLAADEFGMFAYALALALLVEVVPKWGFSGDLIRRSAGARDRLDDLLSASLLVTVVVGLVTFSLVAVVAGASRESAADVWVLVLLLVATLFDACTARLRAAAAALERQAATSMALVANRVVTGLAIVALLLTGQGVVGMGIGYLTGSVLDWLLTTRILRGFGVRLHVRSRRSDVVQVLRGSWVVGLSTVVAMLLFRIDQVIVEALVGTAALAAYAVAYRLVETVLFLTWSLSRAVLPVLARTTEVWRLRRGLSEGVAVLAAVYVPFAVVAVVEPVAVIDLVFGDQYATTSASTLQWLAPAPLLFGVSFLTAQLLIAQQRERWSLMANGIALTLNVVCNLLLIPTYGIAAAAAVTTVTLGVRVVVAVTATPIARAGWSLADACVSASLAGVVLAAVLVVLSAPVLVELAVGGIAYGVAWWALTSWRSPEHIALIRGVLPGGAA